MTSTQTGRGTICGVSSVSEQHNITFKHKPKREDRANGTHNTSIRTRSPGNHRISRDKRSKAVSKQSNKKSGENRVKTAEQGERRSVLVTEGVCMVWCGVGSQENVD